MAEEASSSSGDAPVLSAIAQARDYLTPTAGCDAKFFPTCSTSFTSDSKIWEYMTKSKVLTLLEECELGLDEKAMNDLAETICYIPSSPEDVDFISYCKVFTVLIFLGLHDKILYFVEEQFNDDLLPLCDEETLNDSAYKYHACFKGWRLIDMRNFARHAKEVCAPFFKKHEPGEKCYHYKFPKGVALPFLCHGKALKWGTIAEVMKVTMPRDHGDVEPHNEGGESYFWIWRAYYTDPMRFREHSFKSQRGRGTEDSLGKRKLVATFEVVGNDASIFYFMNSSSYPGDYPTNPLELKEVDYDASDYGVFENRKRSLYMGSRSEGRSGSKSTTET